MESKAADFLLVIPVFREHLRLPPFLRNLLEELRRSQLRVEVQIVDDGSPWEEWEALRRTLTAIDPGEPSRIWLRDPIRLGTNTRKGGAILAGWSVPSTASALAFVDADGAIPAREVRRLFELRRQDAAGREEAWIASRHQVAAGPHRVRRTWIRALSAWLFRTVMRSLLDVPAQDTQCGFKIIPATSRAIVVQETAGFGFCFDLALLLALGRAGIRIREFPVDWSEMPGGNLSLRRHGPAIGHELRELTRRARASRIP